MLRLSIKEVLTDHHQASLTASILNATRESPQATTTTNHPLESHLKEPPSLTASVAATP